MSLPLIDSRTADPARIEWLALFEAAPVGMAQVSLQGRYELVNPALCEMFGYTADQLLALEMPDLIFPEDQDSSNKVVKRLRANEIRKFRGEKRYRHSDGHAVWAVVNAVRIVGSDGMDRLHVFYADITERKQMEEELRHAAGHDPLTGVANRGLFLEIVTLALHRAKRADTRLAVTYIDLDGFKRLNDSYGHEAGDAVLVELARRLGNATRAGDLVARFGGDEFVMLHDPITAGGPDLVVDRIQQALASPVDLPGVRHGIKASVGLSVSTPGVTAMELVDRADRSMYDAKRVRSAQ